MVALSTWALTNCTRGPTVEKIEMPAVTPIVNRAMPKWPRRLADSVEENHIRKGSRGVSE